MSKKVMAAELYAKLIAEGIEEKLMRKTFIERACLPPMSMTPAGASTYYVNAKNEASGAPVKNYYKPASEKAQDNRVDDSKENQELFSIVMVDGLVKQGGGQHRGEVTHVAAFTSRDKAVARFERLNQANRDRALVVAGDPVEGTDVATLQVLHS